MKFFIKNRPNNYPLNNPIELSKLEPGSMGITKEGLLYFRTYQVAACLNDVGSTYTRNINYVNVLVDSLPHDTTILLQL
jgi:hypothetical protein